MPCATPVSSTREPPEYDGLDKYAKLLKQEDVEILAELVEKGKPHDDDEVPF
jgi:succinate dehydrogenase flavin-adding protein (antitoxin of CptAB toxin-antitoxin module)